MNYTYLANHEDFISFVRRLDEDEAMSANYTGVLCEPAFQDLGELIEILGGNEDKYDKEGWGESEEEEGESILDYGPFSGEPQNYPAIAVWFFEKSFDRCGDTGIKILNFISIPDLERDKEQRSQLNVAEYDIQIKEYAEQLRQEYREIDLKKKEKENNDKKYVLENGRIRLLEE